LGEKKVQTSIVASWLSFVGALIILINILVIIASGPIVIPSSPITSVDEILSQKKTWYRISIGIPSLVEGPIIMFWLFIAVLNVSLAASMVLTPERPKGSPYVLILSIILLLTGGGFIIGTILAIIGCLLAFQRRKPISETFIGKLLGALKIDPKTFQLVSRNKRLLSEAAFIVMLVGFLSGLGSSIYLYNADKILHSSTEDALNILVFGELYFDISILNIPIINIGLSIIKWLILTTIIYLVSSKVVGVETDLSDILRATGYAYSPMLLQVFLPILLSTEPILSTSWPLTIIIITYIWLIVALIVGLKECLQTTLTNTLGIITLGCPIYWLLVNKFMLPTIFGGKIPGIFFDINPVEIPLMFISLLFVISYLLGTFKRY
jgi:hypothetical protein